MTQKNNRGTQNIEDADPFKVFILATDVRFCKYEDTHKVLGQTYSMLILQVIKKTCIHFHLFKKNQVIFL